MHILGIESSCDETAASIVDEQGTILSNVIYTQISQHQPYGGVVPEIAARAHIEIMDRTVAEAMQQANMQYSELDAIAVTQGPGLIGGLIVGLMTAKALALATGKPLVGVNHLEGHALTVGMTNNVKPPYMLLLLSGGHCQLMHIKAVGDYELLGHTLDDALGEAFDKTAKMLGLSYPGGPAVEERALQGDASKIALPSPLKGQANHRLNFSFSGMKTAVRQVIINYSKESSEVLSNQQISDICAAFQKAAFAHLIDRLNHMITRDELPSHLVVAGGVAANKALSKALKEWASTYGWQLTVPPAQLCTDNAAMVAWAGLQHFILGNSTALDCEPKARWPLGAV